jgi:hypothetical protein
MSFQRVLRFASLSGICINIYAGWLAGVGKKAGFFKIVEGQ